MTGLYTRDMSRYGDAPQLWLDLYTVTMRLAGKIPDETITHIRGKLAAGEVTQAIGDLVAVSIGSGARLPIAGLKVVPAETFDLSHWLENPPVLGPELPLPDFTFTPLAPRAMAAAGGRLLSLLDISGGVPDMPADLQYQLFGDFGDPLTPGYEADDGIAGVWRAWRSSPDGEERQVYLAEMDPGADVISFLEDARNAVGSDSQVEAYFTGGELPEYQGNVRENGVLLWARKPGEVVVTQIPGEGVQIDGYSTNGRTVWQGAPLAPSTVDGVGIFRARLALKKAGLLP